MDYVLLIHSDETAWAAMPPPAQAELLGAYAAYTRALVEAGVMRGGQRLMPAAGATLLRGDAVLDGPYAETKEQLGGFYMIEAPDHGTALDWARRCPGARHGTVELRAVLAPPPAA